MNKKYEAVEEATERLDWMRYVEGSEKYNQACDTFARGKLAFTDGRGELAHEEFELAQKLFRAAINVYSEIENPDLKKNHLANSYFNLIGSLAENRKSDPNDVIEAINEAKNLDLVSEDWNPQLSKAYYNSGIKQADSRFKVESFSQAKHYDPTSTKSIYSLGAAYMAEGEHNKAKKEFEELLHHKWPEEKFSLEMQLNSWCQLKQCQSELQEDISDTLRSALKFINEKPEVQELHQKMLVDIYIDSIAKGVIEVANIPEIAKVVCKFNLEVTKEMLQSLHYEASSLFEKGCREDAELVEKSIIDLCKDIDIAGEDSGHAD